MLTQQNSHVGSSDTGVIFHTENINVDAHTQADGSSSQQLTDAQLGMLLQSQRMGGGIYNTQVVLSLKESVDIRKLQGVWKYLIKKYEVLRAYVEGTELKITEDCQCNIDIITCPKDKTTLTEVSSRIFNKKITTNCPPLFNLSLFNDGEMSYLIWTHHHVFLSASTFSCILKDMLKCYDSNIETSNSHQEIVPYAIYKSTFTDEQKAYWCQLLEGFHQCNSLKVPLLDHHESIATSENILVKSHIKRSKLKAFAEQAGVTVNTIILAAWSLLLRVYMQEDDLVFGSVRKFPDQYNSQARGMDITTLPVRVNLSGQTIRGLVKEIYQQQQMLKAHVYSSLAKIKKHAYQAENVGDNFFTTCVDYQPDSLQKNLEDACDNMQRRSARFSSRTHYDLALSVTFNDELLVVNLNYDSQLFDKGRETHLIDNYFHFIEQIISHDYKKVSDCTAIDNYVPKKRESHRDKNESIQDIFEKVVTKYANRIALSDDKFSLNYAELNQRATYLATQINKQMASGRIIALHFIPGVNLIISMVAVLKSGNTYLSINPEYPDSSKLHMIKDSGASMILCDESISIKAAIDSSDLSSKEIIIANFDEMNSSNSVEKTHAIVLAEAKPEDTLASLIYTSGSTGKPKGVAITHQGIIRLVKDTNYINFTPDDVVAQIANTSFDASFFEIWGALLNGAQCHVIQKRDVLDFDRFSENIRDNHVSILLCITSLFNKIVQINPSLFSTLRHLVVGGELLDKVFVKAALEHKGNENLVISNAYGPTENTVISTVYTVNDINNIEGKFIPIGESISRTQAYIVGKDRRLLPDGVIGELALSGDGLAAGYHNNPAKTEECFIDLPYPICDRVYLTGDYVYRDNNQQINFVGRIDTQVKINGYRIELDEIKRQLLAHEAIQDASVVVDEMEGRKSLVAFIVYQAATVPTSDLKEFLRRRLPEHMIPTGYIGLSELPMTVNNKLDTRALKKNINHEFFDEINKGESEVNQVENKLIAIWESVFLKKVTLDTGFYDLGGDSITALLIISKAQKEGIKIKVDDIFKYSTVRKIAAHSHPGELAKSNINHKPVTGLLMPSPIQAWYLSKETKEKSVFNQSCVFNIDNTVSVDLIRSSIASLVTYHDALRLQVTRSVIGNSLQLYLLPAENVDRHFILEERLCSLEDQEKIVQEIVKSSREIISAENSVMLHAVLLKNKKNATNKLVISIHHLSVDGVSWRIFSEDFNKLLGEKGSISVLPGKTASYIEWSNYRYMRAQSKEVSLYHDYWENVSRHNQSGNKKMTYSDMSELTHRCSAELTAKSQACAQKTKVSLGHIYLLAFLLSQDEKAFPLQLQMESHGRMNDHEEIDVSRTIGWFTSLYPKTFKKATVSSLFDIAKQMNAANAIGDIYGLLRFLSPDSTLRERFASQKMPETSFNYLGDFTTDENKQCQLVNFDTAISDNFPMDHSLYLDLYLRNAQLHMNIMYCTEQVSPEKVKTLVNNFEKNLNAIVEFYMRKEYYPLSPVQTGIYSHCYSQPETEGYQVQSFLNLSGNISLHRLETACYHLVQSYEALRVKIERISGNILQVVDSDVEPYVSFFDLSSCKEEELDGRIKSQMDFDRQKLFSLSSSPLIRFTLIKLPSSKAKLLITFHHIILDGWSLLRVVSKFLEIYENEKPSEIISMDSEFFASYLARAHKADNPEFWVSYLKDIHFPQRLNFEKRSPEKLSYKEEKHQAHKLILDSALQNKIQSFSQENHVTINTIIQGVWSVLLSEFSRSDDVVYGVTSSGRSQDSFMNESVGLFISTLPVCVRRDHSDTYLEFLEKLQENNNNLHQYEHANLTTIADYMDTKISELFDYLYVFENYPKLDLSRNEMIVDSIEIIEQTEYKLSILVFSGEKIQIKFQYDPLFFSECDIEMFSKHFRETLERFVSMPDHLVKENAFILDKVSDQKVDDNENHVSVIDLFEARANSMPSRIAVEFGSEKVSYQKLCKRVNQIEMALSAHVNPGDRVAIMLPRSIDYITSMLAILRLSCSFIPLDITLPSKRISYIIETSKASVILVDKVLDDFPSVMQIVPADIQCSKWERPMNNLLHRDPSLEAYVLFTSGSTGKPKGVSVSCRSLNHFIYMTSKLFSTDTNSAMLAISPFIFDISLTEIFLPLANGATVFLCDDETLHDAKKLKAMIDTCSPSLMQATPATWRMLLDTGWQPGRSMELISTGEALPIPLAKQLIKHGNVLWNYYGPTECTVWATGGIVNQDSLTSGAYVSIGKPLPGVSCYVLDDELNQLKPGLSGQLYVGGSGVANGYVGNEELTDEVFIQSPFVPNEVLYCTGDLVRYNSRGELEYISRLDNQIKKNGHRIELGEIEKCLSSHEEIKQAVAIPATLEGDRLVIVAFIVLDENVDQSNMNEKKYAVYLREHLPSYMLPNKIVTLDALPLLPNKKTDRSALLHQAKKTIKISSHIVLPENDLEEKLQELWSGVLSVPRENISVEDDYFNLGGDSISAISLSTEIETNFDVYFPVKYILQYASIREMAEKISLQKKKYRTKNVYSEHEVLADLEAPLVSMKVSDHDTNIFFIHPIGGTVFRYLPLAKYLGKHFNVYGIQDPGLEVEAYLFDSLETLSAHYLKVIRAKQPKGPYLIGGASYGGNVSMEIARKMMDETDEQVYVLSFDAWSNYPAIVNNNRDWFEGNILKQEQDLKDMLPGDTKIPELLLDLRWQRQQLIADYQVSKRPYNFCLFKSGTLSPVLEPIQEDHNHWRNYCEKPFDTHVVPGDHLSILKEPNAKTLYQKILLCLEKWQFFSRVESV